MSLFISFEGIDLSGKSTQVNLLGDFLRKQGRTVVSTREPGGTGLGESVRDLLLHGDHVHEWAEAALFAAARAQLVYEIVQPALDAGRDVISDRFIDSSLAYQGFARGLGVDQILEMNHAAIGDLRPALTFVLLLDPYEAYKRTPAQLSLLAGAAGAIAPPDRIEREAMSFMRRVDEGYRELVEMFPERLVPLDAREASRVLASKIRKHVEPLLKRDNIQTAHEVANVAES